MADDDMRLGLNWIQCDSDFVWCVSRNRLRASFFACGKEIASYMELVLSEEFSSRRRLGHI
jgi:hypothetical protein